MDNTFVRESAETYVRFLVAAEAAVLRGQFNVAKVLRALAYAQRTQAMAAARGAAETAVPEDLLAQLIARLQTLYVPEVSEEMRRVAERCVAIAQASLDSLLEHPDVPEWVVDQRLYTCLHCGNMVEGAKPERCDVCGVLSSEFEFFNPFYGATPEHLGQLMPEAIRDLLARTPDRVEALLDGVDEAVMEQKPSSEEWSVKELLGHLVETDDLFLGRMEALRRGTPYQQSVPPWKTHEGKGYEYKSKEALLANLRSARARVLAYIDGLTEQEWVKSGTMLGQPRTLVDTGTWLANHDRGHVAQVERWLR